MTLSGKIQSLIQVGSLYSVTHLPLETFGLAFTMACGSGGLMFSLQRFPGSRLNFGQNSRGRVGCGPAWDLGCFCPPAAFPGMTGDKGWPSLSWDSLEQRVSRCERCCVSVRAPAVAVLPRERRGRQQGQGLAACKTRGVSWWEGRSLPLPSWTLGFLGLALPRACWAEVGLHFSVTNPRGGWGCPRLRLASYQLPFLTKS